MKAQKVEVQKIKEAKRPVLSTILQGNGYEPPQLYSYKLVVDGKEAESWQYGVRANRIREAHAYKWAVVAKLDGVWVLVALTKTQEEAEAKPTRNLAPGCQLVVEII